MSSLFKVINRFSLIQQIIICLLFGIAVSLTFPEAAAQLSLLGTLFVGALKGIAPVLVFFLVIAAISRHRSGKKTGMKSILILYFIGTFSSTVIAVLASFAFPTKLHLANAVNTGTPPDGVAQVLTTLLTNIVQNPVASLANANYIGILGWAVLFGLALRKAASETKDVITSVSDAVTVAVQWVIRLAPLGIMGLVADAIASGGLEALHSYARLILVHLSCVALIAFVVNPFIVFTQIKRNPYPLVLRCLRESGVTAFFTRSSAANIPVNMNLAKRLELSPDTYSISIPLGATINMAGSGVTITMMAMATAYTLGINIDLPTAILLSLISTISACGASGVAGGSLLLIPLACSLFGISNDISMQVVGIGFIIGVIQDAAETALNSSTDILFTAATDYKKYGYREDLV